jgi:hypothetical protein
MSAATQKLSTPIGEVAASAPPKTKTSSMMTRKKWIPPAAFSGGRAPGASRTHGESRCQPCSVNRGSSGVLARISCLGTPIRTRTRAKARIARASGERQPINPVSGIVSISACLEIASQSERRWRSPAGSNKACQSGMLRLMFHSSFNARPKRRQPTRSQADLHSATDDSKVRTALRSASGSTCD